MWNVERWVGFTLYFVFSFFVLGCTPKPLDGTLGGGSAQPSIVPEFDFSDKTDVDPGTLVYSDIIQIRDLTGNEYASVNGSGGSSFLLKDIKPHDSIVQAKGLDFINRGPRSFKFYANGTRGFYLGQSPGTLHQLNFSEAYNVDTLEDSGISFDLTGQEADPIGLAVSPDGTKFMVLGNTGGVLFQYSMGTPFDLTTASYDTVSFDLTGEDTEPMDISFSTDGMKMFMVGDTGNNVYQYSLGTAFDLTSMTYDSVSLNTGVVANAPNALTVVDGGSKLYIVNDASNNIVGYDLGTPYDLTSATLQEHGMWLGSLDTFGWDLHFDPTGNYLYYLATDYDTLFKIELDTPFTLKPAFPVNMNELSLEGIAVDSRGIAMSTDGSKVFYLAGSSDKIYELDLERAFDISTATFNGVEFDTSLQDTQLKGGFEFNPSGTKLYTAGSQTNDVYQYSLSTAFDLSTASYDSVSFDVTAQDGELRCLIFGSNGSKLYICGDDNDRIFQYSLSTPYDIGTASYDTISLDISTLDDDPEDVLFNEDGSEMFLIGETSSKIYKYNLSTPYNLASATLDTPTKSFLSENDEVQDGFFMDDGKSLFILNRGSMYHYELAEPYDISTISYQNPALSLADLDTAYESFRIVNNGTKLFTLGDNTNLIYEYDLSLPYAISSAVYTGQSFSVNGQDISPTGITFNEAGTRLYMVGVANDTVYEYELSTPFSLATASYSTRSMYVGAQDGQPQEVIVTPDGSKIFINGRNADEINQYHLTTPFDVSTGAYSTISYDLFALDQNNIGLTFNSDGTKLYTSGVYSDFIREFELPTAYDVTVVNPTGNNFNFPNIMIDPGAIQFSDNGDLFYYMAAGGSIIQQLDLGDGGGPEFRVCSDPDCNNVLQDWQSDYSIEVQEGQFIQMRTLSSEISGGVRNIQLSFDSIDIDWTVTTR